MISLSSLHSCVPSLIFLLAFLATIETAISARIRNWILECRESASKAAAAPKQHAVVLQILIFTHKCIIFGFNSFVDRINTPTESCIPLSKIKDQIDFCEGK